MNVTSVLRGLRIISSNPLSRIFLAFSTKACGRCGGDRIGLALRKYVGEDLDLCFTCSATYRIISLLVNASGKRFGVEKEQMVEFFSDSVKRRGLMSVLRSISEHGVTLPQKLSAPFLVVWGVTNRCNLRCGHCYANSGRALENELTTQEAHSLIDELADIGVVAIAFSGGEPMLRRDVFELTSHANWRDIYVAMASNGTLITKSVAKKLKNSGVRYIEISIDGSGETHDMLRGVGGAFDSALEALKYCKEEGMLTCMAMTVTRQNYAEVPKVIGLAEEIGVDRFVHFNFIPTRRGKQMAGEDLTPEDREKLLKLLYSKLRKGGIEVFSTAPQYAKVALQEEATPHFSFSFYGGLMGGATKALAEFISGCGAGRLYCGIEANGDVVPCVFMPIRVGNVRRKSFKEIWDNSSLLQALRDRENLKGCCAKCEYKYVCSGCRSRAYAYYGDINAPDPGCILVKEG